MNLLLLLLIYFITNIKTEELNCGSCGQTIASSSDYITINSQESLNKNSHSRFHLFRNEMGVYFQVLTLTDAKVACDSNVYSQNTFFPGYYWGMCSCPYCHSHLGWMFYPNSETCLLKSNEDKNQRCLERSRFFGIIMGNVRNSHTTFAEKSEL